jgi:hypothetical protein
MAGFKAKSSDLNTVLLHIIKLLNKYNICNWFIGYGTLLGIIRNNSCIENDDDIDIIIDINEKNKLDKLCTDLKPQYIYKRNNFYKIEVLKGQPTIDFYLSNVIKDNNKINYNDSWENVIWSDVMPFVKHEWKDVVLNIPNNAELKLISRYGDDWKTPKQSKGVLPKKKII